MTNHPISNELREKVKAYLEQLTKGSKKVSPFQDFEDNEGVSVNLLFPSILSFPELLLSRIGLKRNALKDQLTIWQVDESVLSQSKGVLSCHALSPMGDSVFLLSDLGRALRTAASFNKSFHVMLADKDWSEYNWIASEYGTSNLTRNLSWRKELYKSIGAKVEECNLTNTEVVPKEHIEKIGYAYEDLVRSVYGKEVLGKKIDKGHVAKMKKSFKLYSSKSTRTDFLNIPFIKEKLAPEKEVIMNLLNSLRRFDQNTFIYYFTQRYHQYKYSDYLKVAVRSEMNFDLPFFELDKKEGKRGISSAVYFENYKMDDELFVIPYYFPSGSLYERTEDIDEYYSQTIMLHDFEDEDKLLSLFLKMNFPYNARFFADFLSFLHFYLYPFSNSSSQNEYRSTFNNIIKESSPELYKSWRYYAVNKKNYKEKAETWSHYTLFGAQIDGLVAPYYYIPYVELAKGDPEAMDRYALLFSNILSELVGLIGHPEFH